MKKPRGKRSQKVKSFLKSWLEQSIEGTKTSLWLKPDPANSLRAVCTVCPAVTSFSINEGWKVIIQHNNGKQHKEKLSECQTNPEFHQKKNVTPLISEGFKKMEEKAKEQMASKEELLIAQTRYVFSMMYHGASGPMVDCQANVLPCLFSHDKKVKQWDIR